MKNSSSFYPLCLIILMLSVPFLTYAQSTQEIVIPNVWPRRHDIYTLHIKNLVEAVNKYSNIKAVVGPRFYLDSPRLLDYPFIYISIPTYSNQWRENGQFEGKPAYSLQEIENIKKYIKKGDSS